MPGCPVGRTQNIILLKPDERWDVPWRARALTAPVEPQVADIVKLERRSTMRNISDPVYVAVIAAASLVAALAMPSMALF